MRTSSLLATACCNGYLHGTRVGTRSSACEQLRETPLDLVAGEVKRPRFIDVGFKGMSHCSGLRVRIVAA